MAGCGSGASGGREPGLAVLGSREREGRKEGDGGKREREKKKREKRKGKENWRKEKENGKRNEEKGNGEKGKEGKEKEGGGACQRRPRPQSATRDVAMPVRATGDGHAARREGRKKERGKKRGRDSRRPVATRRVGWGKMGRGLKSGVGLVRKNSGSRVQGLRGVELNERQL